MHSDERQPSAGRLWTLDYVLDLCVAHFLFASYTAMYTIIPLYVVELGGDESQLGIVVGSFGLVGFFARPFAGRWVHSIGAKRVAIAGTAVFAGATLLHLLVSDVWLLVPARALQGVGLALGPVATSTMAANLAPPRRRAEGMGFMGNAISMAALYSPLASFWILERFGFQAAFLCAALICFAGCFAAMGISAARTGIAETDGGGARDDGEGYKAPLVSRYALFPTAVFLTYTITTAPVSTFLPQLAEIRDFGNPGLFFTMNSIFSMGALTASGFVSDRLGRGAMIVPGLLVAAASMFILATTHSWWMFLASGALNGLGFGMIQPSIQSLTVDRTPPRERGSAMATLQAAWDLGGSGGAFALGPIGAITGIAATFGIAGAATVAGAAGYVGGARRSARKVAKTAVGG